MPRKRRRRRLTWSLARAGYLVFKTDRRCLILTPFFAKHCDTILSPLFVSKGLSFGAIIQGDEFFWASYPARCGGCRCLRWVSHTEGCVRHRSMHACTNANGDQVPSSSRTSGRTHLSPSIRLPRTHLQLPHRSMAHNESKYPRPFEFVPERFLDDDGTLKPDDTQNIAFGFGRRMCVGRHFADTSVWSAIATILAVFTLSTPRDAHGREVPVVPKFTSGLAV